MRRVEMQAVLMIAFCLFVPMVVSAQEEATEAEVVASPVEAGPIEAPPIEVPAIEVPAIEVPAIEVTVPFDPEIATREYLDRMTSEEKARSDAYFEGGYWLQLWGFLYGLGVAWILLGGKLSARMRDLAEKVTRRKPMQTVLYTAQWLVVTTVLGFPLLWYQDFLREHQYDLSTQSFGAWFGVEMIDLGASLILLPLLMVPLFGVFRRAPRTWWLWGSVVSIVFLVFIILISPVFLDPLINDYQPLEEGPVRDNILSLARGSGIDVEDVSWFDASKQHNRVSANVSGFMGTMAIRLNDNLLERCTLAEIRAVMAHEIGHYALNHMYELLIYFSVLLVFGFVWVRWSFDRVLKQWGANWGVRGIGDIAGLPLLTVLLSIYFFAMTPVFNTMIRVNESEADLYSLQAAGEPDGAAEAALKLAEYRKMEPGPIEEFIFYDHPSGKTRIRMAMDWKAEKLRE